MRIILVLFSLLAVGYAIPEAPRSRYTPPGPPSLPQEYLPPFPSHEYGPPATSPQIQYGPPAQQYGPPAEQYAPPKPQKLITKNVYIHLPPEEPAEIIESKPIPIQAPKKHYKIIFIKAPTPPTPKAPIIPEQQQDEHKTLVYVLVKKPEPQPQVVLPTVKPTEPSKPEVFFIKYKEDDKKPSPQYGPPSLGPY